MKRPRKAARPRQPIGVDVAQGSETVDPDLVAEMFVRLALAQLGIPVVVSRPAA